jgi:porin
MRHEENHIRLPVCMHRTTCAWARGVPVVLLIIAGPIHAQPVDIPATWGGDFWSRPRLTGTWGGLRDELGKKGVVLDVDLLQTLQGVATGGDSDVTTY